MRALKALAALACTTALTACITPNSGNDGLYTTPIGNAPVTSNPTAYSPALDCLNAYARQHNAAAPRIAVDPGHHDAGHIDAFLEGTGDVDRVLASHRIDDKQGLERQHRITDGRDLVHQVFVDMQAAGGIEQHHVEALQPCHIHGAPRDGKRHLAGHDRQGGDAYLLADVLRTDGHRFKPLRPQSDETKALRALVRTRGDVVVERGRVAGLGEAVAARHARARGHGEA